MACTASSSSSQSLGIEVQSTRALARTKPREPARWKNHVFVIPQTSTVLGPRSKLSLWVSLCTQWGRLHVRTILAFAASPKSKQSHIDWCSQRGHSHKSPHGRQHVARITSSCYLKPQTLRGPFHATCPKSKLSLWVNWCSQRERSHRSSRGRQHVAKITAAQHLEPQMHSMAKAVRRQ